MENERIKLIREIYRWINIDPIYVSLLNTYGLQLGIFTPDESENLKKIIPQIPKTELNRNKYIMAIFKLHGFGFAKVLWKLIQQFPKHMIGDPGDFIFIPDNEKIIKELKVKSVVYYDTVSKIIEAGYIDRIEGLKYKINFRKIMETI